MTTLAVEPITVDPAASPLDSPAQLKPPVGVKLSYALGQVAQSGGFDTALPFLFFYYTAALGLSGGLVGAALAISLAFDAFIDPLVGSWSDGLRSRLGRRLPPMLIGLPLMAGSIGLLFAPPAGLSQAGLFAWLATFSVLVRSFISVFNVPYVALGAELTDGYAERSSVVAWRYIAGTLSGVLITALAYSVFFAGPGGLQRSAAYPGFGWMVAVLLLITCGLCCLGVRRYAASLRQPAGVRGALMVRLWAELGEVFRNRSFRQLFFSSLVFFVAVGLNASLQSHAFVFVWKVQPQQIQLITYAYLLGIFVGIGAGPVLSKHMEKRTVVMIGLSLIVLVWTLLPSLRALGVFTATGAATLPPLMAVSLLAGFAVGLAITAYPSMMADAADEHEHLFRARREGLYFAGLGFAAKAATGLGVLAGGLMLDLVGFPATAGRPGGAMPSDGVLTRLILAHGPAAALVGIVAVALLAPYGISRARHDVLAAELRVRRAADGAAG